MSETATKTGRDVEAPPVQFDELGRECVRSGGCDLTVLSGDVLCFIDQTGDIVHIPRSVLQSMLPALNTYAEHGTFIAPAADAVPAPVVETTERPEFRTDFDGGDV